MTLENSATGLVEAESLEAYFYQSLKNVCDKRNVDAHDHTIAYVVNLLSFYSRSDQFFEWDKKEGYQLSPLALLYGEAMQAQDAKQRQVALRRLGDIALFVSGLFSPSLQRKPVGVDYYINMGGGAYAWLSTDLEGYKSTAANADLFKELACRFSELVNILDEFADSTSLRNDNDLIGMYDHWLSSNDMHAASKLQAKGITISNVSSPSVH